MIGYRQVKTPVSSIINKDFLLSVYDQMSEDDQAQLQRAFGKFPVMRGFGFSSFLELIFRLNFYDQLRRVNEASSRNDSGFA